MSTGAVTNRRGKHCLCWWARTSALLFIIGRHDIKGRGVITVEITGVEIPNKIQRNVIPIQASKPCHASGVGEAMRDKVIVGLVRQKVFLKAFLAVAAEIARSVGLWWEEG
jgi:hypothetical protein